MNLPDLSIKRPIFITCLFSMVLILGLLSYRKIGVDMFPNVTFPVLLITTAYPGAGPNEVETLISGPMEDSFSTLSGVKELRSINKDSLSLVVVLFTLNTDLKYAEQQVRDRLSSLKVKFPTDAKESIVRSMDVADQAVLILSLYADLPPAKLYDLADREIRPLLEQVNDVGLVEIIGGRKREIQVLLDRGKLKEKGLSATYVASRIGAAGKNVPAGKAQSAGKESDVRTIGEFESLKDIGDTLVNFFGNETPVRVSDIAQVKDYFEDEQNRTYVNGNKALTIQIYRRSGANTVTVVEEVKKRIEKINADYKERSLDYKMTIIRDMAKFIRANVNDVRDSILLGIVLTIVVVFFFLGNFRSTIITGIALPDSLLGAFILMAVAGFTVNVMTLLAMSLAVGLLIDDAIVVRENIFRYIELGESPITAASRGAKQVTLAVVATTLTVISVFGPVAFLQGMVGQFFKEFGLTVCFAMAISLMDALAMAPMLSAYFAGNLHVPRRNFVTKTLGRMTDGFYRFQQRMTDGYVRLLGFTLNHPKTVLGSAFLIFALSFLAFQKVPKNFMAEHDSGEFVIFMDLPPGTDIGTTSHKVVEVDEILRSHKEIETTLVNIGGMNASPNEAWIFVSMVPFKQRPMRTSAFKEIIRKDLELFKDINPKVQDPSMFAGISEQPFNVTIIGEDQKQIEAIGSRLFKKLKTHPDLKDVDTSFRPGKPEFRIIPDKTRADVLGVSPTLLGMELRTLIEGSVPVVFRQEGREYDIRVRLSDEQKNLRENFNRTFVPNINNRLVRLSDVAHAVEAEGANTINRIDRGRFVQISAGLNPEGRGVAQVMTDVRTTFSSGEIPLPPGVRYKFVGMADNFMELVENMIIAAILATVFIYLVLASLYESFITPFTIMLVLPLAACGAFYALAFTNTGLDLFSMIGCIMLLGISTKNSILLVDYANRMIAEGKDVKTAITESGRTRLRPIIMTSMALIAGMLPVAIGLTEASRMKVGMGIAVIGGLVSSTLLTLVVIPASYIYVERFRRWVSRLVAKVMTTEEAVKSEFD